MADYQRNIEAELEQLARAVANLPQGSLSELSELELSGVGGILQSFYNGIEITFSEFKKDILPSVP